MFAKCEIKQFFPCCVWVHEVNGFQAMNERMARELHALRSSGTGHGGEDRPWQSRGDLHRLEAFQPLARCMAAAAQGVLDFLACDYQRLAITNCWANVNRHGEAHTIHTHPNNVLSGVYYVRAPMNSGRIVFHDPRQQALVLIPKVTERTAFNAYRHRIDPAEGMLLVFPSWFQHEVESNQSDEERISVSFNVMLEGGLDY